MSAPRKKQNKKVPAHILRFYKKDVNIHVQAVCGGYFTVSLTKALYIEIQKLSRRTSGRRFASAFLCNMNKKYKVSVNCPKSNISFILYL
jgi:hypothetical protein